MEGNRRSRTVIATPSKRAQNAPATSNHRPRPDSIAYAMRNQQGSLSDSLLLPFVLSTGSTKPHDPRRGLRARREDACAAPSGRSGT
jgi:hypothetical protein